METKSEKMKKRILPSWMTAPVDERRVPAKAPKRRRMVAVRTGAATRAPSMKTVYCMNEAELVDVALGILIEGRKQEKPWEQPILADADKPQPSPSSSESPHTSSPRSGSEEEDGGENSPALSLSPSHGSGTPRSTCSRNPEEDKEEEEDSFRYVREIFFS